MASRKQVAGALAAVALVLASAIAIVLMGEVGIPSLPPLTEAPGWDVTGRLAYLDGDVSADERCLRVVAIGREDEGRELQCGQLYGPLSWTDEGAITVEDAGPRRLDRLVVDADSGDVLSRSDNPGFYPEPRWERDDGTRVEIHWEDRVSSVRRTDPDGTVTDLLRHRSYGPYGFAAASWSPDGRWVLVSDSAMRAIIVDPDSGEGRVAAEGAAEPVWGPPDG